MENNHSLTTGKILPSLIRFALPVLLALFLQALYGGIDLLIVGKFSDTANLSGVATGSMLLHTVTMIITGMAMGITILVGQRIGEQNRREAGRAVGVGIMIFLIIAVLMTIGLVFFCDGLSGLLRAPDEAFEETSIYIRICGIGSIFIVAYNVLGAIFRGIGDSKTPLMTVFIACVMNILADLIFVAVFNMGAIGAAIATVLSQGFSVLISYAIIMKKELPFDFSKEFLRFDRCICFNELKLGFPIALQELLVGASFLVIQAIVNNIGVVESAGVGVAEKVCGFIMLVPSAYMQSMAAFVAQNRGAGKPERSKRALLYGIGTSLVISIFIAWFSFFHGNILAGIFAKDALVIAAAFDYLKAYAIDCLLTSILFSMMGYFNGCGKTLFVMAQGLIGALGIRVPVAFMMSQLEGTNLFMIGLATPCSTIIQIVLCCIMFVYYNKKTRKQDRKSNWK